MAVDVSLAVGEFFLQPRSRCGLTVVGSVSAVTTTTSPTTAARSTGFRDGGRGARVEAERESDIEASSFDSCVAGLGTTPDFMFDREVLLLLLLDTGLAALAPSKVK
jgi:hypothetical protein